MHKPISSENQTKYVPNLEFDLEFIALSTLATSGHVQLGTSLWSERKMTTVQHKAVQYYFL